MGLKVAAIVMGVLAFGFLGLTLILKLGGAQPPLVAILCTTAPEAQKATITDLEDLGLSPDVDFRTQIFPCTSPNSPRQAVTSAVGAGANYFLMLDESVAIEARATHIPAIQMHGQEFHTATKELSKLLKDQKSKSATPRN